MPHWTTLRISKAASVFSTLKSHVWNNPSLSQSTRLAVYQAAVLPALLYGAETWTTTERHLDQLECFNMDSIRQAMGVSKLAHIPNITLRAKAKIPRIATLIKICRLRWLGHVWRMSDVRLPKQVLFGELNNGKRPQHKPKVRWRHCITKDIKDVKLSSTWPNLTMNREKWRTEVKQRCAEHNSKLDEDDKKCRAIHKDDGYEDEGCKCHICGQRVTSNKYLKSHIIQKHNEAAKQRRMCQRQQQHTEQINSLMCPVPDCRFIPANQKGCKIHLRRKHS